MAETESVLSALQRNWDMVVAALADLDEANLGARPNDQSNSVAWTLWHMTRVVDTFINVRFQGKPQLWVSARWFEKFGMSEDPDDRGVGWTAEQVAAWKPPSREVLVGYFDAVTTGAKSYIDGMTVADLERRIVAPPVAEPRSVATLLGQMVWDNVAHGGQIAYIRGFYQGMGWHR